MAVQTSPGFNLQPSAERVPTATNYITNFDFLNQYLPDTYEKEFERYGNRTISGFLRMVGAEMPSNSDLIKWAEQGRLHVKYTEVTAAANASTPGTADVYTITATTNANPSGVVTPAFSATSAMAIRNGQTVIISRTTGATGLFKAVVSDVDIINQTFKANYYSATGPAIPAAGTDRFTVFIYGSEFKKGDTGMEGSLESDDIFFENKPIIIKDKYAVSGSDMAQIGWVEIQTENGASGYLWYMKSEHETRLRFDDYLETAMIEAVPAVQG